MLRNLETSPEKYLNENPGVIPNFIGGLGNQMFICAAGYAVSRSIKCPLYIPTQYYHENKHSTIDYNKNIFRFFGNHIPFYFQDCKKYYKDWNKGGFLEWSPSEISTGSVLNSYFQYYPSIKPYENELRYLFLSGLQEYYPRYSIVSERTAFLHIRRGDYLNNPHIHFIQPMRYYAVCIEQLLKRNPNISKFYIFSDDIEYVKSLEYLEDCVEDASMIEYVEEKNELKSLALMSLCKGGAICANSTFSWWGAFLGAHEKRNPVFVPKRWINDNVISLFPEEWHVVSYENGENKWNIT